MDHFEDSRLKLDRAKEHIKELIGLTSGSATDQPWSIKIDFDPAKVEYTYKLVRSKTASKKMRIVIADVVTNLRSALDLAAAASFKLAFIAANPGVAVARAKCHFPFMGAKGGDAIEWGNYVASRCKGVPVDVLDYFRTLKPYEGGDDRLYGLNAIRNENEHWTIAPVLQLSDAIRVDHVDGRPQEIFLTVFGRRLLSGVDEMELFTSNDGPANYKFEIMGSVEIDGVPGFRGAMISTILQDIHTQVTSILAETEAICRRIGILH